MRRFACGAIVLAVAAARCAVAGAPEWPGTAAARTWLHGAIPWWDALAGTGAPTLAAHPSPAFLLPAALLLAIPGGAWPFAAVLRLVAFALARKLLRDLGAGPWSEAGGVLFALAVSDATLPAGAFLPALLLGVERIACGRGGGGGWLIAGLAGTLAGGDGDVAWLDIVFAAAWTTLRLFEAPARAGGPRLARIAGHAAIGGLIAAPILILLWQTPELVPNDATPRLRQLGIPLAALASAGLALATRPTIRPLCAMLAALLVLGIGRAFGLPLLDFCATIAAPMPAADFAVAASPGWSLCLALLAATALRSGSLLKTGAVAALAGSALLAAWLTVPPRLDKATAQAVRDGLGAGRVALLVPGLDTGRDLPGVAVLDAGDPAATGDLLALAAIGISRVVAPAGASPFARPVTLDPPLAGDAKPLELKPGESVTGLFPAAGVPAGTIERAAAEIGTYAGAAQGALDIALCRDAACVSGQAPLETAADNRPLTVTLSPPLAVPAGAVLRWRVTHVGAPAARSVALWLYDPGGGGAPVPRIELEMRTPAYAATLLHRGPAFDVYAVPDPAPLLEADGCTLAASAPDTVRAHCAAPSRMTRRVRDLPGWTATVDGAPAPVTMAAHRLQSIALPAGDATVRFAYAPPGARWALGATVLGTLLWAALAWRGRSRKAPA